MPSASDATATNADGAEAELGAPEIAQPDVVVVVVVERLAVPASSAGASSVDSSELPPSAVAPASLGFFAPASLPLDEGVDDDEHWLAHSVTHPVLQTQSSIATYALMPLEFLLAHPWMHAESLGSQFCTHDASATQLASLSHAWIAPWHAPAADRALL